MGTVSRVGDVRAPLGVCRLLLLESSNLPEGFHGALYLLVVPGLLREVYLYLHLGVSLLLPIPLLNHKSVNFWSTFLN